MSDQTIITSLAALLFAIPSASGQTFRRLPESARVQIASHHPGLSPRHGVPDYLNETNSTPFFFLTANEAADDIHRTTGFDIIGVDVGYYSELPTVDLWLRIYENPSDYVIPGSPLGSYFFPAMPGGGAVFVHLDLPEPLGASPDIWLGVRFDDPNQSSGLLIYHPPTSGYSHNWGRDDIDGNGTLDHGFQNEYPPVSFYFGVYVLPGDCATHVCFGDINADGRIDGDDIQQFVNCDLTGSTPNGDCYRTDINRNGLRADVDDLARFIDRLLTFE